MMWEIDAVFFLRVVSRTIFFITSSCGVRISLIGVGGHSIAVIVLNVGAFRCIVGGYFQDFGVFEIVSIRAVSAFA